MHTLSSPSYIFLCMLKSAVDVDSIHDSYSVSFFFFKYIASTQSYMPLLDTPLVTVTVFSSVGPTVTCHMLNPLKWEHCSVFALLP